MKKRKCSKTDIQCLGKRLKEIMRTEEAYRILPPKYNLWGEGGCRILAKTLAKVIDGKYGLLFQMSERSIILYIKKGICLMQKECENLMNLQNISIKKLANQLVFLLMEIKNEGNKWSERLKYD